MYAARDGRTETARFLLDQGASVDGAGAVSSAVGTDKGPEDLVGAALAKLRTAAADAYVACAPSAGVAQAF